jgi:hypothetical protein
MKAKFVIVFVFLMMLWVTAIGAEYDLVVHLGFLLSVVVGVFALLVILSGLVRAPEGYEDEDGFHIGALAGADLR